MGQYVVTRLLQILPVIILVSVLIFGMVRAIPGDPAAVLLGPDASPEQMASMRADMGLDQPIWIQYARWMQRMARGDFGVSFINGFPVKDLIFRKIPATIELAIAALVFALAVSIPLGIASAVRRGSWIDRLVTLYTSLALGIPSFWLGILMVLLLALSLKWLPPSGYASILEEPLDALRFIIMPAITLGVYISAVFTRFIKSSILEVSHQDYIRTARGKGLPESQVVFVHTVRNALIPLVTVFGIQFGGLLGGAVITETIFDWPGVGRLLVQSIVTRDYSIVQALILMAVTVYLFVNLATDILYGVIDPRVRRQ